MNHKTGSIVSGVLIGVTGASITLSAVVLKQDFWSVIPLYISLVIMLLQAYANRYTFLLGGFNSLLYAAVYFHIGLYAMAAYSALVSFPLQLLTFRNWHKKPYGNATMLKKLGRKKTALLAAVWIVLWLVLWAVFSIFKSGYLLLDNTITLLGLTSTVLCLLSYISFAYIQAASLTVGIVLYALMLRERPMQLTFLIYNVYALICSLRSIIKMNAIHREQEKAI